MSHETEARVILLGASNAVRSLPIGVETARQVLGVGKLDVMAAVGRGRSYGQRSSLLGRSLPGILECGLWTALDQRPRAPTYALVTDIGNDIGYGVDPATLAEWVGECLRRLQRHEARVVLTMLPAARLEGLPSWQIRTARTILFPRSTLTPAEIRRRVRELDRRLRDLARRWEVEWIEQPGEWYGIDPIHIRVGWWSRAWSVMLASWSAGGDATRAGWSFGRWQRLRRMLPERGWLFGWEWHVRQPAGSLADGVRVSLY